MASRQGYPLAKLMLALIPAEITCSLESNMIYSALTTLYARYGDPVQVGWLITAFTLAAAGSAAIGGRLGDIFGRRKVLCILLMLSCMGSLISAATDDLALIIAGRVLQGMTMAILPLCFGIVRETLPPERTGLAVGILGSIYSAMVGVGIVIGGFIVDHLDWQAIFVVSAAVAIIALVAVLCLTPPSRPAGGGERLDLIGGLLFVPALAATLYGLSEVGRGGWIGLHGAMVGGGLATLVLWCWYELRHPDPLLDLRLFRDRQIALVSLGIFLAAAGPMGSSLVLLPLLQQPQWTGIGFGIAAASAGLVKLPGSVASGLLILAGGAASRRAGIRWVLLAGTALTVAGWFALIMTRDSFWMVAGLTVLALSPGIGLVNAMAPHVIISNAPPERTAEATGLLLVIRTIGTGVGAQAIAVCLATSLVTNPAGSQFPSENAYVIAAIAIALLGIASGMAFAGLASAPARPKENLREGVRPNPAR